jgi:hypothetical protein
MTTDIQAIKKVDGIENNEKNDEKIICPKCKADKLTPFKGSTELLDVHSFYQGGFQCNVCKMNYDNDQKLYRCYPCKYDYCEICTKRIANGECMSNLLPPPIKETETTLEEEHATLLSQLSRDKARVEDCKKRVAEETEDMNEYYSATM